MTRLDPRCLKTLFQKIFDKIPYVAVHSINMLDIVYIVCILIIFNPYTMIYNLTLIFTNLFRKDILYSSEVYFPTFDDSVILLPKAGHVITRPGNLDHARPFCGWLHDYVQA